MINRSLAQLYALVVGSVLVGAGIVGFFYSADFSYNPTTHSEVFTILAVNGWHNALHITTGLVGLLAVSYAARTYALTVGIAYIAIAVWGIVVGTDHSIITTLPVNTEDNILHLAIGGVGVIAAIASSSKSVAAPPPASP